MKKFSFLEKTHICAIVTHFSCYLLRFHQIEFKKENRRLSTLLFNYKKKWQRY